MLKLALVLVVIVYANAQLIIPEDLAPKPYAFGFQSTDEFGTTLRREEHSDPNGVVTGSYGYTDAQGLQRIVEYIADAAGFRAQVQTNEPGTLNSAPADVLIRSEFH